MAAIVLAGGGAARLGGEDKCWLQVGGRPILESVVAAVAALADVDQDRDPRHGDESGAPKSKAAEALTVGPIVVVGPRREVVTPVRWTREEPPGAGPVAGLQAGLACLETAALGDDRAASGAAVDLVLVLGGDMPFIGLGLGELLRTALDGGTGHGTDFVEEARAGRPSAGSVDAVIGQDAAGRDQYLCAIWRSAPLRAAVASAASNASLRSLYRAVNVVRRTLPETATLDCDTPEELRRARRLSEEGGQFALSPME